MAENQVNIKGKSDSYDRVLGKIVELNTKLVNEVKQTKDSLEGLNPVYEELAVNAERYAKALNNIKPLRSVRGSAPSSSHTQSTVVPMPQDRLFKQQEELQRKQSKSEQLVNSQKLRNLKSLYMNLESLSSYAKGKGSFTKIIKTGLKQVESYSASTGKQLGKTSVSLDSLAGASGKAGKSLGVVSGSVASTGLAFSGVLAVLGALAIGMTLLGKKGYEAQMEIANTQNVLGESFKKAWEYSKKLNSETGILEARTMKMVSATAQLGTAVGFSNASATNIGIGANKLATNISYATGDSVEGINTAIGQAISSGANTLGQYGINMDDNAAKMWLLQKENINAFTGSVTEATMQYARLGLIMEQASILQYENAGSADNLTARYEALKNQWESVTNTLGVTLQSVFIPVFEWVVDVLEQASDGLLKFINSVRSLANLEPIKVGEDIGPPQSAVDAVHDLYSGYKQTGDELDKLKQQIFSFDELINVNPFDSSIPTVGDIPVPESDETGSKKDKDDKGGIMPTDFNFPSPFAKWKGEFNSFMEGLQEALQSIQVPQLFPNPITAVVSMLEPVITPVWEWLQSLVPNGITEFPINLDLKASLSGEAAGILDALVKTGLFLSGPVGQSVVLTWLGLEVLENFRAYNANWNISLEFLQLEALKEGFTDAVEFLQSKLETAQGWALDVGEAISSWFAGVDIKGFLDTAMKILEILSWVSLLIPGLGEVSAVIKGVSIAGKVAKGAEVASVATKATKSSGFISKLFGGGEGLGAASVPAYATGGFHVKPHLGVVGDVNEATIPFSSPAAKPAFQGIADGLVPYLNGGSEGLGGGSVNITTHLGENSTIIANDYSAKMFADKVADYVEQRLRNTGALSFNRR